MRYTSVARIGALLWAVSIWWLLALPSAAVGSLAAWAPPWPAFDKLVHGGLFFGLTLWLVPALGVGLGSPLRRLSAALGLASVYGVFSEAGQYLFTDRTAEIGDVAADVVGALLAVGVLVGLHTTGVLAQMPAETE